MEFILKIHLGNDAMKDYRDIGDAMKALGSHLEQEWVLAVSGDHGSISDLNGSKVGEWEVQLCALYHGPSNLPCGR